MNEPRKHAELIKAWADGAEVEFKRQDGWHECKYPSWYAENEYRIKPEPDVVMYGYAHNQQGVYRVSTHRGDGDNIKVTFDGETGKLKAAEVLQ